MKHRPDTLNKVSEAARPANVSVIIPVYNAEPFVREAVFSALSSRDVGEILLIEDGSPDSSLAVCEALEKEEDRVRLFRHADGRNLGAGMSRNVGIEKARLPYIAFLDSDDYYLPNRFECAVALLESDPAIDGVYDAVGTQFDNEEMRTWWSETRPGDLTTLSGPVLPKELLSTLCGFGPESGWFHTNGITVRRSLLSKAGPFNPELRMSQDFAMWLKMASVGSLLPGSLTAPVAVRRLHGQNRIFLNRGEEHEMYNSLATYHVLEWASEAGLGPQVLEPLLGKHLRSMRREHISGRQSKRLGVQDLPDVLRLGMRIPYAFRDRRYLRYLRGCLGLGALRDGLGRPRRKPSRRG